MGGMWMGLKDELVVNWEWREKIIGCVVRGWMALVKCEDRSGWENKRGMSPELEMRRRNAYAVSIWLD